MAGQINIAGNNASVNLQGNDSITTDQVFTFPPAGGTLLVSDSNIGLWVRSDTTISPDNAGDSVSIGSGNISLNANGSAEFAGGDIELKADGRINTLTFKSGDLTTSGSAIQGYNNTTDTGQATIYARNNNINGYVFSGYGSDSPTSFIKADGTILLGGTLPSAPNISLNADGTSTFSDDLIVGDTSTGVEVSPNFTGTAANNACEIRFRSVNNTATGVVGLNRSSQGDGLTFSMTTTGSLQIGGNSNTYISGTVSTTTASGPDFARLQSDATNYGLRLYRSSSLRAHKTDIQDLSNAVTLTKALRPVSFKSSIESDLEAPHGGDLQVGFIAEEVEAIHTGLCTYGDGNLSGVCYDRMGAIAIGALKEALTRIEQLEAKVAALES